MDNKTDKQEWMGAEVIRFLVRTFIGLLIGASLTANANPPGLWELAIEPPVTSEERNRLETLDDCSRHRLAAHAGVTIADRQREIRRELIAYQELIEESLAMRAKAIQLLAELREKIEHRIALSGRDLQRLNQGAAAMLEQRATLHRMSLAHECWLQEPLSADPEVAEVHATGILMSLSAALVLYDNYLSAISLYRSDSTLRRHLNRADSGFAIQEQELNKIAVSFASPDNRARVRRGLIWFETNGRLGSTEENQLHEGYRYLVQLIEQSPSRQMVRRARPVEFLGNMFGLFASLSFDTLSGLKNEGVHVSSLLFGNAVGLVESRRGKLDGRKEVETQVTGVVRAGDILLEKTPFRLTDAFIPGHWGHAAVWVGSETELRDLGIWDHPVVQPHQGAIRAGRGVVEALRSGVVMSTMGHFLNIDDLAVLRHEGLPDAQRAEVVLQALRQVGKSYDFNFDVRTTDRIVCSELVYHSYVHLDWPTDRYLGRVTISPDNVAVRSTELGPLSVMLLYHDGEEVLSERRKAMEGLVKAQVVRLARR